MAAKAQQGATGGTHSISLNPARRLAQRFALSCVSFPFVCLKRNTKSHKKEHRRPQIKHSRMCLLFCRDVCVCVCVCSMGGFTAPEILFTPANRAQPGAAPWCIRGLWSAMVMWAAVRAHLTITMTRIMECTLFMSRWSPSTATSAV